jgi:hypothetical protein
MASRPVLVLTEPNDNQGRSVTNSVEQLVGECVTRYLPERDDAEPPCIVVEHYPNCQAGLHRWDPMYEEAFNTVTFDGGWRLQVRAVRELPQRASLATTSGLNPGWRWYRRYHGQPRWRSVSRADVERLIGERFPDESAVEGRLRFEAARADRLRRPGREAGA